jgi:hypothetical protein
MEGEEFMHLAAGRASIKRRLFCRVSRTLGGTLTCEYEPHLVMRWLFLTTADHTSKILTSNQEAPIYRERVCHSDIWPVEH